MKITYRDLFVVKEMLDKIWDLSLSPKIFMRLRRLAKAIENEIKIFDPERIKLFQRHPRYIKDNIFNGPKTGDPGYDEFMVDYNETFSCMTEVPYENIDIEEVEKKLEEGGKDITGTLGNTFLNIIEVLNILNSKKE